MLMNDQSKKDIKLKYYADLNTSLADVECSNTHSYKNFLI